MRAFRFEVALAAATALACALPTVAMADPFVMEWSIFGHSLGAVTYNAPAISGGSIVYVRRSAPGEFSVVDRFNLAGGTSSQLFDEHNTDITSLDISGEWMVAAAWSDIHAKNVKTGTVKALTTDGGLVSDFGPRVSTASGAYVVWTRSDGVDPDVMGKNLAISGSAFTVAGGTGGQGYASIYGKRVAYVNDDGSGHRQILVKTIGSSAPPLKITDNDLDQFEPSIGDHLVAWRVSGAGGRLGIMYYDFDTGQMYNGVWGSNTDLQTMRVSGDRILYGRSEGPSDISLHVFDTRIAKTTPLSASFDVAPSVEFEQYDIDGNQITYRAENEIYYARLAVPTISLKAVPSRIAHGGHIHIAGSISDQGHRIGGASIGVEKYASGKWTRVKTLTANASGEFSYKTPKTYAKTKYRAVYDGRVVLSGLPWANHLSTRSSIKTAWPR